MSTVANIADPTNAQDFPSLRKAVSKTLQSILQVLNGNVDFGSNIHSAGPYTVTFKDPTKPVTIPHNLGRTPVGAITLKLTANAVLYMPSGAQWTGDNIILQASAAVTATLLLI